MLADCDIIVIFPIFGQFGVISKQDSECMVCKTYIFINSKILFFFARNADISNIKEVLVFHFQKLCMCVYLLTKFHIPSVILTSFRWANFTNLPTPIYKYMLPFSILIMFLLISPFSYETFRLSVFK